MDPSVHSRRMAGRPLLIVLMLALAPLAGCLTLGADVEPAAIGVAPAAAGVPSYLHDLSEPIDGVDVFSAIVEPVRVAAADGILLDTWIVRPDIEGPVPLVLEVTPYFGGGTPVVREARHTNLNTAHARLLERGYAVGISSVRGTGNSEGCFTQGGAQEALDTAAVIEALAALPWSNGNVGLIGVSYPGTTPQDVWVEAPPALKTIVPISGISDLYKYNFVNGVPINIQGFGFNTYYWAMVGLSPAGLAGGVQALDPLSVPGAVVGEGCADQVAVQEGGVSSTLDGNKDGYWQERDFLAELSAAPGKERASVFYVHGLQDWNVKPHMMEDWLDAVQAEGVPYKIWIGQWGHNWPQREDWFEITMVAWFDQFLKGIDTGILDAPRVQVQDDAELWRHEDAWPPTDASWVTLHPDASGALGTQPGSGEASYDAFDITEAIGFGTNELLPPDMVLWESAPLEEDWHVSGMPVLEANVTASARRASLMLTLIERNASGDRAFNFAAMSLNHVSSLAAGEDDVSGLTQLVRVRFFPQDDVVHKGSRLVLVAAANLVAGSEPGPSLQPVGEGGTVTISLDVASLALPLDTSIVYEDPQPLPPE